MLATQDHLAPVQDCLLGKSHQLFTEMFGPVSGKDKAQLQEGSRNATPDSLAQIKESEVFLKKNFTSFAFPVFMLSISLSLRLSSIRSVILLLVLSTLAA